MRHRLTRLAPAAAAIAVFAATAAAAALLAQSTAPTTPVAHEDSYIQALDTAVGWPAPDAQRRAADLTAGRTICRMLATGWNEAGVVANMLTWPGNHLTQGQLAIAVHITRLDLCGQQT